MLFFFAFTSMNAQKIKLKKGNVIIDGETYFKYEKRMMASEFSLYSLDGEDEILFILRNNNETIGYGDDDFNQITFIKDKKKLESATLRGYSFKWFVSTLIKNKVLDLEGNIDPDKLETFFAKYDENITERTVRY